MVYDVNYKNGKEYGKSITWYRNGKVKSSKTYKNGKLEGKYVDYHFSGKELSSGTMKGDEMHGKWNFWYHNGQKECEVVCKDGKLIDGKVWDDDGNKKKSIRFNYQR